MEKRVAIRCEEYAERGFSRSDPNKTVSLDPEHKYRVIQVPQARVILLGRDVLSELLMVYSGRTGP